MSTEEIKNIINSKMNDLDEAQLKMVEEFVEKINSPDLNEWDLKRYVDDIVNQRAELLLKLAQ